MHFTLSGILPIPKIFIKVVRGLPALEVLNFRIPDFLKALQYAENPSHLQILPGIKVWNWYLSINLRVGLSTLLLDFLILMCSFIFRESSELVD